MTEEDLASALDRILSERLQEGPATHPNGPREVIDWAIRGIRRRVGVKPDAHPNTLCEWEIIARIRSLPARMQEPLRRYFVFQEAEESICRSIHTTTAAFHRFLREAADYILIRRERMPELETQPTDAASTANQCFPPLSACFGPPITHARVDIDLQRRRRS
jgi:hypothetical protein